MPQTDRNGAKADFQKMQLSILLMYIVIIIVMAVALSTLLLGMSKAMLSEKVSALVAANSRQVEMNINNYLINVETTSTLLFSDKDYYGYDPSNTYLFEYGKIKREEMIASRIVDLALMDSFADFVILYSNGNKVGLMSDTTNGLADMTALYKIMEDCIAGSDRENAWVFNFCDVTDRLYYFKRLNRGAILMASFYSRELSSVFEYPEQLEGMKICLIDDDETVLYSSDMDMLAKPLEKKIVDVIDGRVAQDTSGYFINVNSCENGWRVVCYIEKEVMFRDTDQKNNLAIFLSVLFAVIFAGVGTLVISGITRPVDESVSHLEEEAVRDRLTGLYNKQAFQDKVTGLLSEVRFGDPQIFIMVDMDNFKSVNDTLGHAYGDEVIARMGRLLKGSLSDRYVVGRLGGDEFALYQGVTCSREGAVERIKDDMGVLFAAFSEEYARERSQVDLSLSVGISIQSNERRFKNLYANADNALYTSKHGGKNRYTLYEDDEVENKEG